MKGRTAVLLVALVFVSTLQPTHALGGDHRSPPTVIDRFADGSTNATMAFVGLLSNDSLGIELPRGASVLSAALTVEGIEGTVMPSTVIDYGNTNPGKGLWAKWTEGQGIYPPKVDPYNSKWNAAALVDYLAVAKSDNTVWRTETTDAGRPPFAWPVQLYHFNPALAGAQELTVMWEGMSSCSFNATHDYHCELWLRDHSALEWDQVAQYSSDTDDDVWLNYTFTVPSDYYSANGSVDLAVVGIHSEWAGPMLPAFDVGHLYSDYVALRVNTTGSTEWPSDVGVALGGHAVDVPAGELRGVVRLGDAHGLSAALQAAVNDAVVEPGNITVPVNVSVALSTAGKVQVRDLRVEYEPPENLAPTWRGPALVEVEEDAPTTESLDLDASFEDDHNMGLLEFRLEAVDVNLTASVVRGASGNDTLAVRPDPDFFGDAPVTVRATDRFGACATATLTVRVLQRPDRPVLDAVGELHAEERVPFYYMVAASDVDLPDDRLTFTDDSPAFDIDPATGEIMWTPTPSQIGRHEALVTVTDDYGLGDTRLVTIVVSNSNDAPRITSPLELSARQGEPITYIIRADDPDVPFGDRLTFSAFAESLDLDVDGLTGTVTFTPTNAEVPSFVMLLRVQDTIGSTDEKSLLVSVENVNDPPAFEDVGTLTYLEGQYVQFHLVALDPDLDLGPPVHERLTFEGTGFAPLLPDPSGWVNLTLNQSMVGTHDMTYTVRDEGGLRDTMTVHWVIEDLNGPPVITTVPQVRYYAKEDAPFTSVFQAEDPDGDALTWSDDTDLFDIGTDDGVILFTPVQAQAGTYKINLTVSDGRGEFATRVIELVVMSENDAPQATIVSPEQGARFKTSKSIWLSANATDEDGDVLLFIWKDGERQLAMGQSAVVKGLGPGRHTITLEVGDGTTSVERSVTIEVVGDTAAVGPLVLWAVAVAAVVAVCLVTVLLVGRRRKGGAMGEGQTGAVGDITRGDGP